MKNKANSGNQVLCPLCKQPGEDLVFSFYCSNNKCPNFVSTTKVEKVVNVKTKEEVKNMTGVTICKEPDKGWAFTHSCPNKNCPNFVVNVRYCTSGSLKEIECDDKNKKDKHQYGMCSGLIGITGRIGVDEEPDGGTYVAGVGLV